MKKLLSFILITLLLCGCSPAPDETALKAETNAPDGREEPIKGGILPLQMRVPDTLNPLLTKQQTTLDILLTVYEPLIKLDETLSPVCCLADSYHVQDGAQRVTLALKRGVLWHDGREFSAADVVHSVNFIKKNPQSPFYKLAEVIGDIAAPDSHTVVLSLSRPYSQIVFGLYFPIVPAHKTDIDASPDGTGAYMFEEYQPLKSLTLKRFAKWHGGDAYIEKLAVALLRDDKTATEAFNSSRIFALTDSVFDLGNYSLKQNVRISRFPTGRFEFLAFNHQSPVFSSATMRSAVSRAVNRAEITSNVSFEGALPANMPIYPASGVFSPSSALIAYDFEYANELIFHDGWADLDGNGSLEKETEDRKIPLSVRLLLNADNPRRAAAAEMIKNDLATIGITVKIEVRGWDEYRAALLAGDYDFALSGAALAAPYDMDFLLSSSGGANIFGYRSAYMDNALFNLASAPSRESFAGEAFKLQDVFEREQPVAGIAFLSAALITAPCIGGDLSPLPYSPYGNIHKWYIKAQ